MNSALLITALVSFVLLPTLTHSYEVDRLNIWVCPGQQIQRVNCLDRTAVLQLLSMTIYSSTDTTAIEAEGNTCSVSSKTNQCERRITTADSGVSADYRYLYNWVVSRCVGMNACETVKVPEWWDLIGETDNPAKFITPGGTITRSCPQGGVKYVSGILLDFSCRANENDIVTVAPPPSTTPRARPTTPTTTTAFPVIFFVYLPGLEPREKIILGVVIGLAIAILLVLLLILYCWDRWRRHQKFNKLLRMLGRPQGRDDEFDELENYGKADAWRDETNNADALGEYTGVKPDEFLTIDRNHMEKSGMIYSDSTIGTMSTMGRNNTASTLNRHGGNGYRPEVQPGTGGYNGPIDYDTEANLELERRMAAALEGDDDADIQDTKH